MRVRTDGVALAKRFETLVVLRSFSMAPGLTGLRAQACLGLSVSSLIFASIGAFSAFWAILDLLLKALLKRTCTKVQVRLWIFGSIDLVSRQ